MKTYELLLRDSEHNLDFIIYYDATDNIEVSEHLRDKYPECDLLEVNEVIPNRMFTKEVWNSFWREQ